MNAIIIEDEKPSARRLQRMLSKLAIEVNTLLHSVEEAVTWFQQNPNPDLIFLDVQLSDGLSFEIFEKVDVQSAIIFTTAYDEYALKAFKLNSIDYLLKPIDNEELEMAIKKYKSQNSTSKIDLHAFKSLLTEENPSEKTYRKRFTSKVGQHLKVFSTEDIECFFSENKGTYLHTKTNRNYLLDTILENLENELDPKKFFRVNRKFIVKIDAIKDIIHYSNSRLKVELKNYSGDMIIVSRERVKDFKAWLGE